MSYLLLKYAHVLGSAILFGTGLGIAFFMFFAVRTKDVAGIAHTTRLVVVADYIFTLSAALLQPLTGALLVWHGGYDFFDFWVMASLGLYVFIGLCWIPVVFMQIEMSQLAKKAAFEQRALPARFHTLYRRWFLMGWPAFIAILVIFWLMLSKPVAYSII